MSSIDKTIRAIRPSLRLAAPQTYWFSLGFGVFNLVIGSLILNGQIFVTLQVIGAVPLSVWALLFIVHGASMLAALYINSWKFTRSLNVVGVGIKVAWLLEVVAITIAGRSSFILVVWLLLLFFQIINFLYFMPRVSREQ